VDLRINEAAVEGQRELMRRLMAPVRAMATKLAEVPADGKACPIFRDTLIGNLKEIAGLAPKLNIGGDAQIDQFAREIGQLALYHPDHLRRDPSERDVAQMHAAALLAKMDGYRL
jgi:hypothetical protein